MTDLASFQYLVTDTPGWYSRQIESNYDFSSEEHVSQEFKDVYWSMMTHVYENLKIMKTDDEEFHAAITISVPMRPDGYFEIDTYNVADQSIPTNNVEVETKIRSRIIEALGHGADHVRLSLSIYGDILEWFPDGFGDGWGREDQEEKPAGS